jgi:Leucine-rich repeat (LRR) protein
MTCSILFLVLHCWLFVSVVGDQCPFEECDCVQEVIDCENRDLTEIPALTDGPYIGHWILRLDSNKITDLDDDTFPPNLRQIDLSKNPISTIDIAAFDDSQDTLETLSFSAARFTRIPNVLLHVYKLKSFSVSDTKIEDWNNIAINHIALTIERLHLVNVNIHTWPTWLQNFGHLVELSLDSNSLSSLPDNALNSLTGKLTTLILRNNKFTTIPKAVSKLTANVDISSNLITQLTDTSFPANSNIKSLTLTSNPIVTISQNAFKNLQHLQTLTLKNSTLTRLPIALGSLTAVTSFDISGSPNLVCTCQEKSLASWFLSIRSNTANVCGSVSIDYFFQNLSKLCP